MGLENSSYKLKDDGIGTVHHNSKNNKHYMKLFGEWHFLGIYPSLHEMISDFQKSLTKECTDECLPIKEEDGKFPVDAS